MSATPPPSCIGEPAAGSIWIGKTGKLRRLPKPDSGLVAPLNRGATLHQLAGGGASVTRRPTTRRTYTATWSAQLAEAADELVALYSGTRGVGPYALVDPTWRNLLSEPASTGGLVRGANTVWHVGTGLALLDQATAPPPAAPLAGVLRVANPANGTGIWCGERPSSLLYAPEAGAAVPVIPGLPYQFSVWLRSPTVARTASLYLCGVPDAPVSGATQLVGYTLLVPTTWQRFVVTLSAAASATWTNVTQLAPFLSPSDFLVSDLLIAAPQVAISLDNSLPWVTGLGCPRVVIPDNMENVSTIWHRRSHTLTMAQV